MIAEEDAGTPHGQSLPGALGPQPAEAARPALRERRPDARPALRADGHVPAGGRAAPGSSRGRQSHQHGEARPREAPLPEPGPDPRDLRSLGAEVRATRIEGAGPTQEA